MKALEQITFQDKLELPEGDKEYTDFFNLVDKLYQANLAKMTLGISPAGMRTAWFSWISQLAQAPDAMSGLYQVEIKLNGCNKTLASGLFAKTEIKPENNATYVTIPVDAVIEGNGKEAFVYTAADNKAHKQPVKVAFMKDGMVLLTSGIEKGVNVVTDGSAYLTDGVAVKIMQ